MGSQGPTQDDAPAAGDTAARAATMLRTRMDQAPYQTIGIAIGLGVVLGGGMWRLLARSLLGLGARAFVAQVIPSISDQSQSSYEET